MDINFEAANMAGYNNPKIEVFSVVANPDDNTLISAPRKTDVSNSLNRGSIPLMLLTYPDGAGGAQVQVLHLRIVASVEGSDVIQFSDGVIAVTYTTGSEQPLIGAPD